MLTVLKYIALVGTFFIYTTSGVFSKLASQREFLSPGYIAFLACTVGVLGIYAVLWQQIIKKHGTIEAASYLFVPTLAFACFKEISESTSFIRTIFILNKNTLVHY
jgi:hypothetical protein